MAFFYSIFSSGGALCRALGLAFLLVLAFGRSASAQESPRRQILLLHSYAAGDDWVSDITRGVVSALQTHTEKWRLSVEVLDSQARFDEEYQAQCLELLRLKYQDRKWDLVFTADDNALLFAIRFRERLFPGVPMVFCGVNDFPGVSLQNQKGITGVLESVHHLETLQLAMRLHPQARNLVVVTDRSQTGRVFRAQIEESVAHLSKPVTHQFWDGLGLAEMEVRLSRLSPDTLVYLAHFRQDPDGTRYSNSEIVSRLAAGCPVPLYTSNSGLFHEEVVGGYITRGFDQGEAMARLGAQILQGARPEDLPPDRNPSIHPAFHFSALSRFRIPAAALPAGSVILGKPQASLTEEVLPWIGAWTILVAFPAFGMLVWLLLVRRRRRDRASSDLLSSTILVSQEMEIKNRLEKKRLLAQKMEAIRRLANSAAHDLNNAITPILGYGELAERRIRDEADPLKKHLQSIRDAALRASAIGGQLLTIGRKQLTRCDRVNLNTLVLFLEKRIRDELGGSIQYERHLGSELKEIYADSASLEQVLWNLISNAKAAMSAGGKLVLETFNLHVTERSADSIEGPPAGDYAALSLQDTGVVLDPSAQECLFEPYFPIDYRKDKKPGLEMASVYFTMQQHRGHLHYHGRKGEGNRFLLYFPVSQEDLRHAEREELRPEPAGKCRTVLVAEDDSILRQILVFALEKAGYKVLAAEDGKEALDLSREYGEPIDLLVTDVVMPHKNGVELARAMAGERNGLQVIYISGQPDEVFSEQGVRRGEIDLLAKPFLTEQLLQKIQEIFPS